MHQSSGNPPATHEEFPPEFGRWYAIFGLAAYLGLEDGHDIRSAAAASDGAHSRIHGADLDTLLMLDGYLFGQTPPPPIFTGEDAPSYALRTVRKDISARPKSEVFLELYALLSNPTSGVH